MVTRRTSLQHDLKQAAESAKQLAAKKDTAPALARPVSTAASESAPTAGEARSQPEEDATTLIDLLNDRFLRSFELFAQNFDEFFLK